jgi:cytochrome c oxidase subunit 4
MYIAVFAALLVLTLATWLVARVDLGWANDVVALAIAVTKALLVILFFMHVRHSTRMTMITALAGFFWLAILISLTLNDYGTRYTPQHPGTAFIEAPGK